MHRGLCDRCRRDYPINRESRFQPACPRCGRPLRMILPARDRPFLFHPQKFPHRAVVSTEDASGRRRRTHRWLFPVAMGGGFCLLIALSWRAWPGHPPPAPLVTSMVSGRHTPFEAALQGAKEWRLRAIIAAPEQMSPQQERNPTARRQQIPANSPDLQRAREAARRGLTLARNRRDTYRALQLLANIDCDLGDHKAELRTARQLVALEPRNVVSLSWLQRAAQDNGLEPLERQAASALKTLRDAAELRNKAPILPLPPRRLPPARLPGRPGRQPSLIGHCPALGNLTARPRP
jgi:hypothetical protein